ncbi:MAG TPA: heavy metal translocating P-type ATPase, partial [Devosia sp.]
MTATIDTTRFRVEGMDCASCATKVDTAVRRIDGIEDVSVSVVSGTMTVKHSTAADLNDVAGKVSKLGYKATALPPKPESAQPSKPVQYTVDAIAEHPRRDPSVDEPLQGSTRAQPPTRETSKKAALEGLHGNDDFFEEGPWWKTTKARLTMFAAIAVAVAFIAGRIFPQIEQWVFIVAMIVGLPPIARRAYVGAISGTPFSIETLMSVAAVGAVFISAAEEAAIVVLLFLVGELLEGVATSRARASIKALATLVPKTALRESGGKTEEVPADSLALQDIILVRPGDRVPADGNILSGESAIDEAPVTGESVPKRKQVDDPVFAGTVNQDGALRIRVTAAAADNTISRIIALVEQAQESKAPTERFIDRFSRYYTPGVMVVAAFISILPPLVTGEPWNEWIYKGLAVLLIGCPCALVISTPAAIAAALSAGARRGLLMKGGAVLESLGKINMVALDKTGTLTAGKPQVTDIVAGSMSERETLELAAALEVGSSHPLASAILAKAKADGIQPAQSTHAGAVGGKGVVGTVNGVELFLGSPKAVAEMVALNAELDARIVALNDEGKTVSVLLANGVVAGLIAMRDEPRPDAVEGLKALKDLGADIVMLTGDNTRTAAAIGKTLGIEPRAELLPQDKQRIVGELKT